MVILSDILEFFKNDGNKEYIINETIKAYRDKPDTVKDIDKYIKEQICLNDKVSIIKFIEFFKDAINYTKWFDDNKERMESRTINKSEESKNLFDSDYTDGSVIDMFIEGGDTDTNDKKLFEDAITKILNVLKKPDSIKELNVLTLCVMTKINHYLAKFSFYMCVKNVKISRVNKIADIMGSFIKTNQNNLISNYENEICRLLKCNLTDLETFVNNLPISEIMDKSKAYKNKYIELLTDVYNFNTSNEKVKKQYEEFKTYNTYKGCVNKFKSNIESEVNSINYGSINENIKNNDVFDNVDHNIITKFILQNLELKVDHHVSYNSIRDDVKNVYSFLPYLEAIHSSIADSTTFDTSKNEIEFSAWNDNNNNKDKTTDNKHTKTIKETLQKFITDITSYDFKFNFKDMLDNQKTDVKDDGHRVYQKTDIKTTISYDNKLYGARYSIFPYNIKNFPSDDYIHTATILCIFYKYFKNNASDNYREDCQKFITSYMRLQLYQTENIKNDKGETLNNDDAKYNKDIIKKIVESRNILDIIKNNIEKSINYIINEFIQYTCIINNKSYDSIDDAFKKQINIDNINYVDNADNVNNISDLIGFIYINNYDNAKVKKIIKKITTTDKNDNIQNIYDPIHEFLEKVYTTVNNNLIVYNITLNTNFNDLKTKYNDITTINANIVTKINNLITEAIPKINIKDVNKQTINTILSKSINADYVKSILDNIYELTLKTERVQDVKDVLNRKYYDKFIDENKYNEKTLDSEINEYNKTLNVFGKIYDNTIITNKSTCSAQSDTINNLLELIKYVDDTKIIDDKDKDSIKKSLKDLIKTSIKELTKSYKAIYEHVNKEFLSGFNKFKNGLIKSTDDVVIQHVWFNALRKIHNIQSIQDIEKTEKPKNKYNILSLVNRKSTEIPKGDSQLIDKFFLNNHVPFNAANITSQINKISGGYKDDIECMNIYEQIFKRIQDILASRKIKLNVSDTERINDKIKKLKRTEKRLLEIFKTMAYYTSIPDLTRRSDVSYDDMNETIDEYKHKYEEYHKLTDNMINSLNKLNKIVTEITNNINA